MLNGVAPLLIFNFYKLLPQLDVTGVPLLSSLTDSIPLVPIPIYLDEKITGIYITDENKNIDVDTQIQPKINDQSLGGVSQRGINSSVTINMRALTTAPLVSVLIAMSDILFDKVAKQEYSVTYINKSILIFGGLVQNFSCVQDKNTNLYEISLVLSKATGNSTVVEAAAAQVPNTTSASLTQGPT